MSWLLKSIVGDVSSDNKDNDSGEAGIQKFNESGVAEDISVLTKTFTRKLKGFSSFISGEDVIQKPHDTKNDSVEDSKLSDSAISEVESKNIKKSEIEVQSAKEVTTQSSRETIGDESGKQEKDDSEKPKLSVKGIHSDFAELSGSLRNQFSKISQAVRVGRGEDFVSSKRSKGVDDDSESTFILDSSAEKNEAGAKAMDSGPSQGLFPFFGLGTSRPKEDSRGSKSSLSGDEGEEEDEDLEGENLLQAAREDLGALKDSLVNKFSNITKLASNFLPLKSEEAESEEENGWGLGEEEAAVGLNETTISFVENLVLNESSWINFPLAEEEEDKDFALTDNQLVHIEAMEFAVPGLAGLRLELTPEHMSEGRFWKLYFVMIAGKLQEEETEVLLSEEVLEARRGAIQVLQSKVRGGKSIGEETPEEEEQPGGEEPEQESEKETKSEKKESGTSDAVLTLKDTSLPSASLDEAQGKETIEGSKVEEGTQQVADLDADVDEWLDKDDVSKSPMKSAENEEDISFSDLEADDEESEQVAKRKMEGSDSSTEWQKIDGEEV